MPKLYQQPSNQNSQGIKFSVTDACDRIKDEISHLQQQLHSLKMEYEKVVQEKSDMQRQYVMYYEITCGLNVEMHRQAELAKRYGAILAQILPFLTQEHQSQVAAAMERAKQNMDDNKLPKMSNSPFSGMNPGNMEIYKMMASMGGMNGLPGMPPLPGNNMGSSGRGGVNSQNSGNNNNGLGSLNSPSSLPFNTNNSSSMNSNQSSNNPAAVMAQAMAMLAASSSSNSNNNPLMNPAMALSALMNDKNMDDKQKQSAASAMAAALASASSGNQMSQMSNQNQMIAAMMAASAANSQNLDPSQISNLMSVLAASGQGGPSNLNNNHSNHSSRHSNSGPDEKRRKINEKLNEDMIKTEADMTVDEQKIRNHFENGDKSEMSNRSRTSTPNHLSSNSNSRRQFLSTPTPTSHVSNPSSRPSSANEAPRTASNPAQCLPDFNLPLEPNQPVSGFTKFNKPLSVDANHHSATPPPPSLGAPLLTNSGRGSVSQCTTPTGNQQLNSGQNTPNSVISNPPLFDMRNRAPYSFVIRDDNPPVPLPMAPELFTGPGLPKSLKKQTVLEHGEVVCAVTLSPSSHQIFTGGRGAVKIWDASFLENSLENNNENDMSLNGKFYPSTIKEPLFTMDALNKENYIRSMKLPKDGKTIIIGGEANVLSIWDLGSGNPVPKGDLKSLAPACYALYVSPDGKLCYSCCSDGCIAIWDIHNQNLVHQFNGHTDGASCIDGSGDIIWTGGLDKQVCCWDIRKLSSSDNDLSNNPMPIHRYNFPSQVFSLGCNSNWVAVGLEAKLIEVLSPDEPQSYQLNLHDSCVLSLKFANSSEWFVSTGKDHTINAWRTPYGANLCQVKESSSVLSCDISSDDRYIITGSGERRATIYEVMT